jgi:hypothetical protein
MALRTIPVVFIVLLASIVSSAPARAQRALVGVDGCAILASVVYTEVTEARLGYSTGLNANPLYAGRGEITLCNQATRSVTSAFASALRHTNIHVTWGFHTGYGGDYCLSHYLSQCYPRGNRAMPALSKSDRSFVMRSWQAVQDSVEYRMARYPGSDVARFQADELRRSIRRSVLAGSIENQWYQYAH